MYQKNIETLDIPSDIATLIVDDDKIIQRMHTFLLNSAGLSSKPMLFDNGKDALDFISEQNPSRYLVFLDINMPIMNGWEFLDSINKSILKDDLLIVIVSSSISAADFKKAESYPQVISFLTKPINIDMLKSLKNAIS